MLLDKPLDPADLLKDENERERVRFIIETLDNLISSNQKGSVTVAINGDWGSGKTTYLRAIEGFYKDYCLSPVVFFEAWKYQDDNEPLVSLLLAIQDIPGLKANIKGRITKLIKPLLASGLFFSDLILKTFTGGDLSKLRENFKLIEDKQLKLISRYKKNLRLLKDTIEDLLKNYKPTKKSKDREWKEYVEGWKVSPHSKIFVLIIDDLDRLIPAKAFRLVEALRFYFDIDNTLIIMGVNDEILNRYVREKYGLQGINSEKFIEKVFCWSYEIPYAPLNDLHLRSLREILDEEKINAIRNVLGKIDNLTHRKWIKLINRIEKKSLFYGQDNLEFALLEAVLKELYPEFELFSRKFVGVSRHIYDGRIEREAEEIVKSAIKRIWDDHSYFEFPERNYLGLMQQIREMRVEEKEV